MKGKILLIILLMFPIVLNAKCDYKTEKNMTSLSLYIDYSYEFNKNTNSFDIYLYNLQNVFVANYEGQSYTQNNEVTIIPNILEGTEGAITIVGSGISQCSSKIFRYIQVSIPYINPYYGSNECEGYENLAVCYSKFLNFKITHSLFKKSIKREDESEIIIESETILDEVVSFAKNHYIKIILVITISTITILIYRNKYRKSKHGF